MHAKTDSELTSLAPSSPDRHRPAYFVQSPSHDGEKTATSFNSTPMLTSPVGSPRHSSTGDGGGGHSRQSSTSRYSGPVKAAPAKIASYDARSAGRSHRYDGFANWEFDLMEEKGFGDDDDAGDRFSSRCYFLAFFVGFFVVFSLFSLILWGVSRSQKPRITMQSIKFDRFMIQAGSDYSGVSTDMISLNSTLKFNYKNTATFFGVHVSSTPVSLYFQQLRIASGDVEEFYKKRKQEANVSVVVIGDMIPMYGNGGGVTTDSGMTNNPVTIKLEFTVESRARVLGKLVRQRFQNRVECFFVFRIMKLDVPISLKNCNYHRS